MSRRTRWLKDSVAATSALEEATVLWHCPTVKTWQMRDAIRLRTPWEAYVCAAAESLPLDDDAVVGYWAMEFQKGKGCDEVMGALYATDEDRIR